MWIKLKYSTKWFKDKINNNNNKNIMYSEDNVISPHPDDMENLVNRNNVLDSAQLGTDRGFNVISRNVVSESDGRVRNKRIKIYTTTSNRGSKIRDAETGEYYSNRVGSRDEHLFFKVILATGECTSANGSSTLFFSSPQHYMNHLHCDVNQDIISSWEIRRDKRLRDAKTERKEKHNAIVIH